MRFQLSLCEIDQSVLDAYHIRIGVNPHSLCENAYNSIVTEDITHGKSSMTGEELLHLKHL